jgi:hypothetical protein
MPLKFLTPHLADTMPGVAKAIPWLLLLDALMIAGGIVAVFALTNYRIRLTREDANQLIVGHQGNFFRVSYRFLVSARRSLIGLGVIVTLTWIVLSLTNNISPALTEVFLLVILGGVIFPSYLAVRMLEVSFERVAETLERLVLPSVTS